MGRLSRSLSDGEVVVMRLRPHGGALLLPSVVLVVVMGLGGFLAASVPEGGYRPAGRTAVAAAVALVVVRAAVVPWLRWRTTTLTVTDRRVATRSGVLRSVARDVPLWRVADVGVERSVLQRVVGSGTLLLDTTGERGGLLVRDVPGVERVARELRDLLDDLDAETGWSPPDGSGGPADRREGSRRLSGRPEPR